MPAPKLLTHDGQTHSLSEWARRLGMRLSTLSQRIRGERSIAAALTNPIGMTKRGTRRGAGCLRPDGYIVLWMDGSPIMEHVHIAEQALGRKLRGAEEVHHFNEDRSDNRNDNLIICPDYAYHALLHLRQKALAECGNASYRLCKFCGRYDDPAAMYGCPSSFYHRKCAAQYKRNYRHSLKERSCQPKP